MSKKKKKKKKKKTDVKKEGKEKKRNRKEKREIEITREERIYTCLGFRSLIMVAEKTLKSHTTIYVPLSLPPSRLHIHLVACKPRAPRAWFDDGLRRVVLLYHMRLVRVKAIFLNEYQDILLDYI